MTLEDLDRRLRAVEAKVGIVPTPVPADPRPVIPITGNAGLNGRVFKSPCIVRIYGVITVDKDVMVESSDVTIEGATADACIRRIYGVSYARILNFKRGTSNIVVKDLKLEGIDDKFVCASKDGLKALAIDNVANLTLFNVGFGNVGDCISQISANGLRVEKCYTTGPIGRHFFFLGSQNSKNVVVTGCTIEHPSMTENVIRIDESGTTAPATGVVFEDLEITASTKAAISARSFAGLTIRRIKVHGDFPVSLGDGDVAGQVARDAVIEDIVSDGQIQIRSWVSGDVKIHNSAGAREIAIAPDPQNTKQQPATCRVILSGSQAPVKWYPATAETRSAVKVARQ